MSASRPSALPRAPAVVTLKALGFERGFPFALNTLRFERRFDFALNTVSPLGAEGLFTPTALKAEHFEC